MPPIVIAGAIAGGAALGGAAITAHAAGKAAKGQEDAARQAQAFNQKVYDEQKLRMAPFEALGTDAMKRYGSYVAMPFNERLANLGQPYNPRMAAGAPFAFGPQQPPQAPQPPALPVAPTGGTATGPMPGSDFGLGGGGMVRLQAPTGEVQEVPAAVADGLIARGARRI